MDFPLGQRSRELPGPLLLTGHTGFKGTWMTFLLEYLNIPLVGYSLPAESDSLYVRSERAGIIPEVFADIRDYEELERFIDLHRPSTIIHMAAQPLVLNSYENPRETFEVNVMGTVNVLEIAQKKDFVQAIVVVTTDKVYRNDDSGRVFVETDSLEGKDPYSASKVGAEAVVAGWQQINKVSTGPKITSVRSGNVVGGGDFAKNRLIPDLMRSYIHGKPFVVRNPESTRPWQHVLDPLSGYIKTLDFLLEGNELKSVNFGPNSESLKVSEVVRIVTEVLNLEELDLQIIGTSSLKHFESQVLNLDSNLAKSVLRFNPLWNQQDSIRRTIQWWKDYVENNYNAAQLIERDVADFINSLENQGKAN